MTSARPARNTRTAKRMSPERRTGARRTPARAFARLVKIVDRLRDPGGCPWDRRQNHRSLLPYLVEETYELKDALLSRRPERVREELGDLLLQIVMHARLAAERGRFTVADVADRVSDKLVRRHPHVFGPPRKRLSPRQVLHRWERIKLAEKPSRRPSVLQGLTRSMPALLRAYRVQEKVAQFGFDWQRTEEVETKLREETEEFHAAFVRGGRARAAEELGDLLFTLVNLSRHLGVDPETALDRTTARFADRFACVERRLRRRGIDPARAGLALLEEEWQAVKRQARPGRGGNRPAARAGAGRGRRRRT